MVTAGDAILWHAFFARLGTRRFYWVVGADAGVWFAVLAQSGEPFGLLEPGVDLLEGLLCRRDPVRKQRAQECVAVYEAALPIGRCAPRAPRLRGRAAADGAVASGRCSLAPCRWGCLGRGCGCGPCCRLGARGS